MDCHGFEILILAISFLSTLCMLARCRSPHPDEHLMWEAINLVNNCSLEKQPVVGHASSSDGRDERLRLKDCSLVTLIKFLGGNPGFRSLA